MAAIAIVAGRRTHGNSHRVLAGESVRRLLRAGVGLQGQGFVRGEHLRQEGQGDTEALPRRPTELSLGISGDHVDQRRLTGIGLEEGGIAGVGAEPHLRLGMRRRAPPTHEIGDRGV